MNSVDTLSMAGASSWAFLSRFFLYPIPLTVAYTVVVVLNKPLNPTEKSKLPIMNIRYIWVIYKSATHTKLLQAQQTIIMMRSYDMLRIDRFYYVIYNTVASLT